MTGNHRSNIQSRRSATLQVTYKLVRNFFKFYIFCILFFQFYIFCILFFQFYFFFLCFFLIKLHYTTALETLPSASKFVLSPLFPPPSPRTHVVWLSLTLCFPDARSSIFLMLIFCGSLFKIFPNCFQR